MNKTFKVVFNRARGALMVANEITSSIQKKGTKTVLAAALISALASGAYATDSASYIDGDFSFTESTTIRTETKTPDIVESNQWNRHYTYHSTYAYTGIAGTESGKKTVVTVAGGATLTIDGDYSGYSDLSWRNSVFLITALSGGTVETTGTIEGNISIPGGKSKIIPNTPCGIYGNNGNITINGNLTATVQSGENDSRGVDATNNSKIVFKGNTTNITVNNGTQNGTAAYGVYAHENGTVDFEGNTTLTVDGKIGNATGALASEEEDGNSVINFKGDETLIDVYAEESVFDGQSISGVSASSSGIVSFTGKTVQINATLKEKTSQSNAGDNHTAQALSSLAGSHVTFNADAVLTAKAAETGATCGVAITRASPPSVSTAGNITFNGTLQITSEANANDAYGIFYYGNEADSKTTNGVFSVAKKTTMDVSSTEGEGYGILVANTVKAIELADTDIDVASTYGAAYGIYGFQTTEGTQSNLLNVDGALTLTVNANGEEGYAFGVSLRGGTVTLGAKEKEVTIEAIGANTATNKGVIGIETANETHLTVEGSKADITVKNGNESYGVANYYGAVVDFNSDVTNITVDNSKKTDAGYQFGVWTDYATTNFNGEANITVKANLFKYPWEDLSESESQTVGLWTVGSSQANFKEAATIDVSTEGADTTYGVFLTNSDWYEWEDSEERWLYGQYPGKASFEKSLTVTSSAKTANAYGIYNNGKAIECVWSETNDERIETEDGWAYIKAEYTGTDGELSVAGKTTITATSNSGNAYGLWAEDNGKTIALSDLDITSSSNYGNATGIYATKTEDDTADVLVSATGDVDITVAASKGSGTAYGVDLHGGEVSLGSKGKTVKITAATGSKAAAFNVTEGITFNEDEGFTEGETLSESETLSVGGTLNMGSADSRLASVHLKVGDGIGYIGLIDGKDSAVNIYADSYKQEGSAWGLGVADGTLKMNVGSFESTTKHVAVNAQSDTGIVATTFSATTTNDDPSVANLQASNNATLNVTADTVTLIASKEENCGAISIPGHGTVNLTANKALSITGNIDAKYASIDNKDVSATFNVKSKGTLSLDGSINIGAPTDDTFYSVKDFVSGANKTIFSRETTVNVESAGAATFTGDINVWGNGSTFGEKAEDHTVSLELGDGSTITGNISVLGQGATTQTNAVTITATGTEENLTFSGNITAKHGSSVNLDGGTYTVSKLDVDSTSSLTLTDATLNLTGEVAGSNLTLKGTTNVNTTLAIAFDGITQDEQKHVTATAEDSISARLNVTAEKTSSITIAEAFTFTGGLLDTMRDAYDEVSLLFKNATLKVDSGTEEKTSISTDLEVSDITGNGNISIAAGKTLTLGSGKAESQSTIRFITLEADADSQNGATLATTNKAEVSVNEIHGSKYGTLSIAGESTLNATKISETGKILLDNATLNATAIKTSGVISLTNEAIYEGETLTISHSNDAADAVGFSAVETSTDETSAGISIDITGDTSISVTSSTKSVTALSLEGKTDTDLTGNVVITAASEGKTTVYGVREVKGKATLGAEGKDVSITASSAEGSTVRALSVESEGNVTVAGKTIEVESTAGRALQAYDKSTLKVGNDKTESISLDSTDMAVFALRGGQVSLTADTIEVTTASDYGSIHSQNNTDTSTIPTDASKVEIKANKLTVTNTKEDATKESAGLSAFSNGILTVDAKNLTVTGQAAIYARGNAKVTVAGGTDHTTTLTGDIVFGTGKEASTSGSIINANVDVTLTGEKSSWTGRSYQEYLVDGSMTKSVALTGNPTNNGDVTGFNLTLEDGAEWTLTGDSFVNNLVVKGGSTVDATEAGTLNGNITLKDTSEVIAPLTTAYKGVSLAGEEKLATMGEDFGSRLTISDKSDKSAILTINDVFTYTSDVLTAMTDAYKAITLHLTNATLKLVTTEESKPATIATNLATSSITSEGDAALDVSLEDGKTLTLGVGETTSQSNVGTISLTALTAEDGTTQGATLKATNKTTVKAEEVAGDNHGIIIVTEASTLETKSVTGTRKIEVTDNSTLKASTIDSHGAIQLDAGSTIEVGTLSQKKAASTDAAVTLEENSHLTAGQISSVKDLSLGKNTSLTLGADEKTEKSSIENITFNTDAGEKASATVNVTKATKAEVTSIEGKGTLHVAEKSELEVGAIKNVAEVKVNDASVKVEELHGDGDTTVALHEESTLEVESVKDLAKVEVKAGSTLQATTIENVKEIALTGESAMAVHTLSATDAAISVGEVGGAGAKLSVKNLAMTGGSIFIDPAYGHSTFHVESLASGTLDTNITTGSGASVIFGSATEEEVNSAVSGVKGLSNVSALVFMKKGIKVGSAGSLIIDPTATAEVTGFEKKVLIRNGGTLVINQTAVGNSAVFDEATALVIQNEANIGIVNAALGTINLGTTVTEEAGSTLTLYTDSPFLTASLASNGLITIAETADTDCISAVATMGIQSMIRHADAVLAETIADRIAEDKAGTGLWVTVRGERYEQDDVGSGFKADVGYGAFGADFAPTKGTRLGVAVQYGHGKVKGNAYSVKNKFKDYSATLYGSAVLGDTGINLLGEVAYTQSKNDISTTYNTALNQDLDAKMYSAGITAQKSFAVGNVNITPSVGVRVSRIETDAMKVGPTTIAKQKQTVVQIPVAVRLSSKAIETASGWSVTPRFKVAYIPTFGDKKIDVFGSKSTVLDTSPVQGSFGINFKKGGFSFDAAAQCGVGNRGTSSIGGKIGLSYAF